MPKNPHAVLTRLFIPAVAAVAAGAQRRIAVFFASDGTLILDPDGQAPLCEVPIVPPLPEELAFIPWEVARRRAPRSAVSCRR